METPIFSAKIFLGALLNYFAEFSTFWQQLFTRVAGLNAKNRASVSCIKLNLMNVSIGGLQHLVF